MNMESKIEIPKHGYGTMSLTWTPTPTPTPESVRLLTYVRDKYHVAIYNSGLAYQFADEYNSVDLFTKFCKEVNDSTLIFSVKIGLNLETMMPSGNKESIDSDIATITHKFSSVPVKPKIIAVCGRIDRNIPIEDTVSFMYEHVKKGEVDGIGLSECSSDTINRAVSAAPISVLELEFSMLSQDILKDGILKTASDHGIPIQCYSPMARGLLTDKCVETENFIQSIPESDLRRAFQMDRFTPEIFEKNMVVIRKLYDFAHQVKNTSLEGLALSYIFAVSERENFEGINKVSQLVPIPSGSTQEKIDKNYSAIVDLNENDMNHIQNVLNNSKVEGNRYNEYYNQFLSV